MIRRLFTLVVLAAIAAFIYLQFAMPSMPSIALQLFAHLSPRAAVRGFIDAAVREDEAGMKNFASRASQDLTSLGAIVNQMKGEWSVGDDFVEDGQARVRVENDEKDIEAVAIAVKEEGGWRVDLIATGVEFMKATMRK